MQAHNSMFTTNKPVSFHKVTWKPFKIRTNLVMIYSRFKSLEYISCTEATQAWGYSKKEKNSLWGARVVQEMCCVRRTKPLICKDDEFRVNLLSDAFEKLISGM